MLPSKPNHVEFLGALFAENLLLALDSLPITVPQKLSLACGRSRELDSAQVTAKVLWFGGRPGMLPFSDEFVGRRRSRGRLV